ncbi:succinylglutamate desuccinylase/aspartoacylase family protein [Oscillatoria laete-virens NRMC-F 0139]|nr:succinylglutamate desuccinylase/aspartoacylase family protein [Oscillatoria laete-virens]MDL5055627.1 succinylglutamate desuccinylase/aspartoacylase family protein [Oscillatoria laete-virens NRMC-F 0139]
MKIGTIEAQAGSKAYGKYVTGETHGRFEVHIPLHIIAGSKPGPTLVVQAGTSGLEIEPALILPQVAKALDASRVSGTVVIVPLMNTSGFEFEQIASVWDNKHLNEVGRGRADGTVSEQMIHQYYQNVIAKADALVDIRTGAQWGYHRYAGVYREGSVEASKALAIALGLPQVVLGQPADQSMAFEAAKDGKAVVAAHIGGGPGLRDYREEDLKRFQNAVLNAMRHLKMLDEGVEYESDRMQVIEAHSFLMPSGERGFTFMDKTKRGKAVSAGEELGYIRHPFTGEIVERITAPRAGVVVHAGASWPVQLEGLVLAIVGDLVEEISVR